MNFKRQQKQNEPGTAIGLSLDEHYNLAAASTISTASGSNLSRDALLEPAPRRITATLPTWTAHTHPVELKIPRFSSTVEIARAIIEKSVKRDADTKKIFGTIQTDAVAYDFTKQAEGNVTYLTIAPLNETQKTVSRTQELLNSGQHIHVEPRTHSIWRAAKRLLLSQTQEETSSQPEQSALATSAAEREGPQVVAILAIDRTGYGTAIGTTNLSAPAYAVEEGDSKESGLSDQTAALAIITEAVDRLSDSMLSEATLKAIKVNSNSRISIFITCEPELWPEIEEKLSRTNERFIPLQMLDAPEETTDERLEAEAPDNLHTVAAWGAALASTPERSATDSYGQIVDLSEALTERLDRIEQETRAAKQREQQQRRQRAATPMTLIPLTALALGLALIFGAWQEKRMLEQQEASENSRTAQLNEYIKKHDDRTKTFSYYQDLSKEIFSKRKNQTRVAQLQLDLDRLWPAQDNSWTVTNLRSVQPNSDQIEILGRTKNLKAYEDFAQALEFEPNNTFTDVAPTFGHVSAGGAQAAASATASSLQPNSGASPAPDGGIYEWAIRARYNLPQTNQTTTPAQPKTAPPTTPQQISRTAPEAQKP